MHLCLHLFYSCILLKRHLFVYLLAMMQSPKFFKAGFRQCRSTRTHTCTQTYVLFSVLWCPTGLVWFPQSISKNRSPLVFLSLLWLRLVTAVLFYHNVSVRLSLFVSLSICLSLSPLPLPVSLSLSLFGTMLACRTLSLFLQRSLLLTSLHVQEAVNHSATASVWKWP